MEYKDYYRILGVERHASDKAIKQAYRGLARRYHPDVNPDAGAEEKFKEINEAYTVLSDPEKRRHYEELESSYHYWQRSGDTGGFDWTRWMRGSRKPQEADTRSGSPFSDFFDAIFGDNNRRRETVFETAPTRGNDAEMEVVVSLEEAYHGTAYTIRSGKNAFNAHIPPGVQTGTKIRFAQQGKSGAGGGGSGDLYIKVQVKEHPIFERREADLHMELDVPLYTAVLGGEIRVPTLSGSVRVKIPAGTQSGQTIRVKRRGMPVLQEEGTFGDLYARVLIQVPVDLSEDEVLLFQRLSGLRRHRQL